MRRSSARAVPYAPHPTGAGRGWVKACSLRGLAVAQLAIIRLSKLRDWSGRMEAGLTNLCRRVFCSKRTRRVMARRRVRNGDDAVVGTDDGSPTARAWPAATPSATQSALRIGNRRWRRRADKGTTKVLERMSQPCACTGSGSRSPHRTPTHRKSGSCATRLRPLRALGAAGGVAGAVVFVGECGHDEGAIARRGDGLEIEDG